MTLFLINGIGWDFGWEDCRVVVFVFFYSSRMESLRMESPCMESPCVESPCVGILAYEDSARGDSAHGVFMCGDSMYRLTMEEATGEDSGVGSLSRLLIEAFFLALFPSRMWLYGEIVILWCRETCLF